MPRFIPNRDDLKSRITQKPSDYPICINLECTLRLRCLHALETTDEHMQKPVITCINPNIYEGSAPCSEFRDVDGKCTFAFGFTHIAEVLKAQGKYRAFMAECLKHYCRTIYYDMYKGIHTITPEDQVCLLQCAQTAGATFPLPPFDDEVEVRRW